MGQEEYGNLLSALHLQPDNHIWVAGSTHKGEEELILDAFARLQKLFPALRLIIAPRRVERAEDINVLVTDKGLKPVLKTQLTVGPSVRPGTTDADARPRAGADRRG